MQTQHLKINPGTVLILLFGIFILNLALVYKIGVYDEKIGYLEDQNKEYKLFRDRILEKGFLNAAQR